MISPREASDPSVPETATAVGRTSVLNYRTFSVNFGDFVSSSLQTSCKKCKGQVFRPSVGTVCVHWELAAKLVAEKVSYPTVRFSQHNEWVHLLIHKINPVHPLTGCISKQAYSWFFWWRFRRCQPSQNFPLYSNEQSIRFSLFCALSLIALYLTAVTAWFRA